MLSNYHGTEVTTVQHTQKNGTKTEVPAPMILKDYSLCMGGEEKADVLQSL
jgi:hypothetical protein